MTRFQPHGKKKKCWTAMNRRVIILLILLAVMRPTNAGINMTKYIIGEKGIRGTDVILELETDSPIRCALSCSKTTTGPKCLGFNWVPDIFTCETLFSLRNVSEEIASTMYIQETETPLSVKQLEFPSISDTVKGPIAAVNWLHNCQTNGFAVGVASTTQLTNLDFMICAHPPGLDVKTPGGFTSINNNKNCTQHEGHHVLESIWSNSKFYNNPSEFRNACRPMRSSNYHVDANRCLRVEPMKGVVSYEGVEFYATILQCPKHMSAISISMRNGEDAAVDCCLIYQ